MSELRDRNIVAFERFDADLAARIKNHRRGPDVVLKRDGVRVDVTVRGVSLYNGNAARNGVRHLSRFLARPARLDLQYDVDFVAGYLEADYAGDFARLEKILDEARAAAVWSPPPSTPYTMICLGVGLGFHLDAIFDRLPVKILFVTECNFELFERSLEVFDWEKFFRRVEEESVSFSLYLTDISHYAAYMFFEHMRKSCRSAVDGMYFYKHYEQPFFDQVQGHVVRDMPWFLHQFGSFEDEVAQLDNTVANLGQARRIHLVEPPRPAGKVPTAAELAAAENDLTAAVVGSGPSLADSLQELSGLQGKAVIVSAGSAVLPLLKAGIRPDFHVEVERDASVFLNHSEIRRKYDLDGVTYVLPTTIDPGFLRDFPESDVIVFLRDFLCPSILLSGLVRPLVPSGPTADHAALGVVLALGMRRVVLVGNDYGSREAGVHHVEGSVHEEEFFTSAMVKGALERYHDFNLVVEGNFGGPIHTNFNFLTRKQALEQAIKVFNRVRFFNASDGVRVEGAAPLRKISDLPDLSRDRRADVRALRTNIRNAPIDTALIKERLEATRRAATTRQLSEHLASALESAADDHRVFHAFTEFFSDADVDEMFKVMIAGDIHRNLFVHSLIAKRCRDRDSRREIDRAFLGSFMARMRALEDRLVKIPDLAPAG